MRVSCLVIQDLLPLYCDNECSEESKNIVKEHLNECSSCNEIYKKFKTDVFTNEFNKIENQKDVQAIKKYNKRIKFTTINITLFLLAIILYWLFWFLKAYAWIKYDDNLADIISVIMYITIGIIIFTSIVIIVNMISAFSRKVKNKLIVSSFLCKLYYSLPSVVIICF